MWKKAESGEIISGIDKKNVQQQKSECKSWKDKGESKNRKKMAGRMGEKKNSKTVQWNHNRKSVERNNENKWKDVTLEGSEKNEECYLNGGEKK